MQYEKKEKGVGSELPRNLSTDLIVKATTVRQVKHERLAVKHNARATSARASKVHLNRETSNDALNDNSLLKEIEQMNIKCAINNSIQALVSKYPYIETLRQTSDRYKQSLITIETLARFNIILKKLTAHKININTEAEIEKLNDFVKENRSLRIQLKYLLSEQDENQRNIDRAKENMFGIRPRLSIDSLNKNCASTAKRELIKFRDHLLKENDELLLKLKLKLN
eukprot:TRINITY_DN11801_c0_g1_i2.p1 TRINITY_DN11801_c0_g1~~TRINITY_DN11801_c0_g1_i2.p1  ORF type:complete len:225 (-),score=44.95 TRINITY_DN11801_c0_g1_i2:152-826(-)